VGRGAAISGLLLANLLRAATSVVLVYAAFKLFLTLSMAARGAPLQFILAVLLRDGVYAVAAAFLLASLGLRGTWRELARRAGAVKLDRVLGWLIVSLCAAGAACALFVAVENQGERPPNRFGFVTSYYPSTTTLAPAKPNIPGYTVRTNSDGYRDAEFGPAKPGVRRALVVGDSMVAGSGIEDEQGLLDRRLEQHLEGKTGSPWEVWNLGATPGALWYYAETVRNIAPAARPDLVVVSYVRLFDLEAFEIQRLYKGAHPRLVSAYHRFGLDRQVMLEGLRSVGALESDPEGRAEAHERARRTLERVMTDLERLEIQLVIFLPHGPEPAFAAFEGDPRVTFLDWRAVAALDRKEVEDLRLVADPNDAWWRDDRICFVGDGHPRPLGNDLIAEAIATRVR